MTSSIKIGASLWALSIQYYVVQAIVAALWTAPTGFSLTGNTISDLGNTMCAQYGVRFVCSPGYGAMNASFVVLGITMIVGAYLLTRGLSQRIVSHVGFGFMALAGLGTLLVGLFPENTIGSMHILGAGLSFVAGNLGMIVLGSSLSFLPKWLRIYTIVSGVVALIALPLFLAKVYLGIDIGGMERIVAYPQSIWMTVLGCYLLARRRTLVLPYRTRG